MVTDGARRICYIAEMDQEQAPRRDLVGEAFEGVLAARRDQGSPAFQRRDAPGWIDKVWAALVRMAKGAKPN